MGTDFHNNDDKILEMDCDNGCTTWMYLVLLNCTLKNGSNGTFLLHIFYHNKRKEWTGEGPD